MCCAPNSQYTTHGRQKVSSIIVPNFDKVFWSWLY